MRVTRGKKKGANACGGTGKSNGTLVLGGLKWESLWEKGGGGGLNLICNGDSSLTLNRGSDSICILEEREPALDPTSPGKRDILEPYIKREEIGTSIFETRKAGFGLVSLGINLWGYSKMRGHARERKRMQTAWLGQGVATHWKPGIRRSWDEEGAERAREKRAGRTHEKVSSLHEE